MTANGHNICVPQHTPHANFGTGALQSWRQYVLWQWCWPAWQPTDGMSDGSPNPHQTATPPLPRPPRQVRYHAPTFLPRRRTNRPHQAQRAVSAMTLEERVGQLVMVPLLAGSDPSSLASTIADEHIGSAILIGNWNTGADTVKTATAQLQGYAPGRQSSHHRHRSGGWSGAASDWYRFRHNAQCR